MPTESPSNPPPRSRTDAPVSCTRSEELSPGVKDIATLVDVLTGRTTAAEDRYWIELNRKALTHAIARLDDDISFS